MAALIIGFAAETASLFDEFWLTVLAVFAPLVLLLTAALAVGLGEKVTLPAAVVSGVLVGCLSGIAFVLGVFSPFPLGLGGRDSADLGGDLPQSAVLLWSFILCGAGGGAVGAVGGTAAWLLRISLGQKPADH